MSSPGIPANTAVGTGAAFQLVSGPIPKSTTNYITSDSGTWICNGATPVTVAAPNVTANSQILFTLKTVGGTVSPTCPNVLTITAGTGFTCAGVASDTSTYSWMRIG